MGERRRELLFSEIIAFEMYQKYEIERKSTLINRLYSVVIETIKIIASTIVSGYSIDMTGTVDNIVLFTIKWCGRFIAVYFVVSCLVRLICFIIDSYYNLDSVFFNKDRIKRKYEIISRNYTTVALEYAEEADRYCDCDIKLCIIYASHAVDCYSKAADSLFDIVPQQNKKRTWRERSNISLLDYLGYDNLKVTVRICINSLLRLKQQMETISKSEHISQLKEYAKTIQITQESLTEAIEKLMIVSERLEYRKVSFEKQGITV